MPLGLGPLAERGADPAELTEDVADRLLRVDRAEQPQRRARRPSGPLRLPYREQHRAVRAQQVGQVQRIAEIAREPDALGRGLLRVPAPALDQQGQRGGAQRLGAAGHVAQLAEHVRGAAGRLQR